MPFTRIDEAFKSSKEHLKNSQNPEELKDYLVRTLVLVVVAEYEVYIEDLFAKRAQKCNDPHIIAFFKSQISQKFRSPDLHKINEILKKLDPAIQIKFSSTITNTESHTAWDNIMRARHAIVHKAGLLNMTYDELINSYPKTKQVLDELKNTLGI